MYIFSKKNSKRQTIVHNDPIYSKWTQPKLTSYGSVGSSEFALSSDVATVSTFARATWKILDGSTSTVGILLGEGSSNCYLLFYTNTPTRFNSFRVQNRDTYPDSAPSAMTFWESTNGSSWTAAGSHTNTVQEPKAFWSCNWSPTGAFKYHKIQCDWNASMAGLMEMWIDADYISGYNTWEEEL